MEQTQAIQEARAELLEIRNELNALLTRAVRVSKNLRHAACVAAPVAVLSTGPIKAELFLSGAIRDVIEDEWQELCRCVGLLADDTMEAIRQVVEDDGGKLLEAGT